MSVQTLEQRRADLLRLIAAAEVELARVDAAIAADLARRNRRRHSRYDPAPCGTERAYQRHRYLNEPVDDDCAEAHRLHNRVRDRGRAS